jgi:hypothetical protein
MIARARRHGTRTSSTPSRLPASWSLGFGAAGRVQRRPVIFVHGNNDTPFATACNPFGYIHAMAQFPGRSVTLARTWLRTDAALPLVRRFVAIDGPNHGIINCSPSPANFYQLPASGGFTPDSSPVPGIRGRRHAAGPLSARVRVNQDLGVALG